MRLNVSEIKDWETCPQYHAIKWIAKRSREDDQQALRVGQVVHKYLEEQFRNPELDPCRPKKLGEMHEEDEKLRPALEVALYTWTDKTLRHPPWSQVILVEEEIERDIAQFDDGEALTLFGKPDAVVRWQGKLWHVQHKTIGGSRSIPPFVMGQAVSLHEAAYAWLIRQRFPNEPYGGTMLNIVRKLGLKTVQAKPGSALHLEFVPISIRLQTEALRDIIDAAKIIRESYLRHEDAVYVEGPQVPREYRNREACTGKYGNRLCQYYGLCWQGGRIQDLPETDPLAYYMAEEGKTDDQ